MRKKIAHLLLSDLSLLIGRIAKKERMLFIFAGCLILSTGVFLGILCQLLLKAVQTCKSSSSRKKRKSTNVCVSFSSAHRTSHRCRLSDHQLGRIDSPAHQRFHLGRTTTSRSADDERRPTIRLECSGEEQLVESIQRERQSARQRSRRGANPRSRR